MARDDAAKTIAMGYRNPRADVAALASALERLAIKLGVNSITRWSTSWRTKIIRAVQRKQHQELRAWHLKYKSAESSVFPNRDYAVRAVFLQSERKERRSGIDRAQLMRVSYDDLRPAQRRAVDIICGSKAKSKKNPIEKEAIGIANLITQFLTEGKPRGRPKGARTNRVLVQEQDTDLYEIRLSLSDICDAAIPIIQEAAGAAITARQDDAACDVLLSVVTMYLHVEDVRAALAQDLSRRKRQ